MPISKTNTLLTPRLAVPVLPPPLKPLQPIVTVALQAIEKAAQNLQQLQGGPGVQPPAGWPTTALEEGSEATEQVTLVQNRLSELGYLDLAEVGAAVGTYGDLTETAVRQFQLANNLPPTGVADVDTLSLMGVGGTSLDELRGAGGGLPIGHPIGVAADGDVPSLDGPRTGVITGTADGNLRETGSADGKLVAAFPPGTEVTIVQPQPADAPDGWTWVEAQTADGQTVAGYLANDPNGIDRLRETLPPGVGERLEQLGYTAPGIEASEADISSFQLMNGLEPTGTLDAATLDAMWSADARVSTHVVQVTDANYNPSGPPRSADCGPASVAMALASAGLLDIDNANPATAIALMRERTGDPDRTGPDDLERAVAASGGETFPVGSREELQTAVLSGNPVVLFGNDPRWGGHWVTVLGYDPATDTYVVSDPMAHDGVATWSAERMETFDDYSTYDSVGVTNPNQ